MIFCWVLWSHFFIICVCAFKTSRHCRLSQIRNCFGCFNHMFKAYLHLCALSAFSGNIDIPFTQSSADIYESNYYHTTCPNITSFCTSLCPFQSGDDICGKKHVPVAVCWPHQDALSSPPYVIGVTHLRRIRHGRVVNVIIITTS